MSLGDSRTQAGPWQATLAAALAAEWGSTVTPVDAGRDYAAAYASWAPWFSFSDPARLAMYLDRVPDGAEVPLVLINLGINDVQAGSLNQANFETAYLYILDTIHARWPDAQVWLTSGVWSRGVSTVGQDLVAGWIANVIAARPTFAHAGPDERVWFAPNVDTYSVDGIHWDTTDAGNAAAVSEWLAALGY